MRCAELPGLGIKRSRDADVKPEMQLCLSFGYLFYHFHGSHRDRKANWPHKGRRRLAQAGLRAFGCRLRARSARSTFEKGNQKTFRLQWLPVCCCTMSSRASDAEDALMLKAVLATCGRPHREAQHMARHTHGRYRGTRVGRRDQSGDFED